MSNVKSALLVGVGGQGAILISKIMSNGFMQAGYDVKQSEVHGMPSGAAACPRRSAGAIRSMGPCSAGVRRTSWWPWRKWRPCAMRNS